MILRASTIDDSSQIRALVHRSYSHFYKQCYSEEALDTALPLFCSPKPDLFGSGRFYVAFDGGDLIACGGWSAEHPGTGEIKEGLGYVRQFATDPDHVRMGLAHRIMIASEDQAMQSGISRFDCISSPYAAPFYRRMGYASEGKSTVMLSGQYPLATEAFSKGLSIQ